MNTANNQELSILSRFDFNKFKGVYYYGSWRFQSYQGSILTLIQSLVERSIRLSILSRFDFNDFLNHTVRYCNQLSILSRFDFNTNMTLLGMRLFILSILSRFDFNWSMAGNATNVTVSFNPIKVRF